MPDITMCKGTGCSLKDTCYRHLAVPTPLRQSEFVAPPFKITITGRLLCQYYFEVDGSLATRKTI